MVIFGQTQVIRTNLTKPRVHLFGHLFYPALNKVGVKIACVLLNPFPNKPLVLHVCSINPLKIQWEKEKLLFTCFQPF